MDPSRPDVDRPSHEDSMPDVPAQSSSSLVSASLKRDASAVSTATTGTTGRLLKGRGPLEAELVDSYYWSGNMLKDYIFFVRQWHPVLAICLHHKRHPYTKKMRVFVFLVTIFCPMFPAAVLEYLSERDEGQPASWWKLELWITLPSFLLNYILYKISVMDRRCAPKIGQDLAERMIQCVLRMFATLCKATCYFCVTMTMVAPLVTFLVYQAGSHECGFCSWHHMFEPWFFSMASSFVSWFPIHLFMPITGFLWHWNKERWEGKPPLEKLERLEEVNGYRWSEDLLA